MVEFNNKGILAMPLLVFIVHARMFLMSSMFFFSSFYLFVFVFFRIRVRLHL